MYRPPPNEDFMSSISTASGFVYVNTFPGRQRTPPQKDILESQKRDTQLDEEPCDVNEIRSEICSSAVQSTGVLVLDRNTSFDFTTDQCGDEEITCKTSAGKLELCQKCTAVDRECASHYCPQCEMKFCIRCFREHSRWMNTHEPISLSRWDQLCTKGHCDQIQTCTTEITKTEHVGERSLRARQCSKSVQDDSGFIDIGYKDRVPRGSETKRENVQEDNSCGSQYLVIGNKKAVSQCSIGIKDLADKQTCCIIDMCVLNTETIVIADSTNCKLTEINIKTMTKNRVHLLNDYPRALAHIGGTCMQVIVAYPQGVLAYFSLDDERQRPSHIQLNGNECSSICVKEDKLYISIPKTICIYDVKTECLVLRYDFNIYFGEEMSSTQRICVSDSILIISDPNNGLLFFDTETETIRNYNKTLKRPTAICCDSSGGIYVACAKAVEHLKGEAAISSYGKAYGINEPFAVCLSESTSKMLFVAQWSCNYVKCFIM